MDKQSSTRSGADARKSSVSRVLDALPQPTCALSGDGRSGHLNTAWHRQLGQAPGGDGGDWLDWAHPEDRERVQAAWPQALEKGERFDIEVRLSHAGQGYRWCLVQVRPQRARNGALRGWHCSPVDVHDRIAAAQALARTSMLQSKMLDACIDCVKIIDPDGSLLHINRAGCVALGVSLDGPRFSLKWLDLLPRAVRKRGLVALAKARKGQPARFAGMSVVDDNPPQYWDNILTPVPDEHGQVSMIVCMSRDVTAQREAQRRLRAAGVTDDLTGLPNRRAFNAALKRTLARRREGGPGVGLLLVDMDHFKHVNDMLGYHAGDHLLRVLAQRLKDRFPGGAVASRLGGDEFAVVLPGIEDGGQLLLEAHRVQALLQEAVEYRGKRITPGASIGCALSPRDGTTAFDLMIGADAALKDLKNHGRGGVRVFDPRMLLAAERMAEHLRLARRVLQTDAVRVAYVPRVALEDGRIIGFQAQLRWYDAGNDMLRRADEFLEARHHFELASAIGAAERLQVVRDLAAWRDRGLVLQRVSIKVMPVELLGEDFTPGLLAALDAHDLSPDLIEVLVAEDTLLQRGAELVARNLSLLDHCGVRIALADFGSGHFSFEHLRQYAVRGLTISPTLVGRMSVDAGSRAIVQAICQLGPVLQVEVQAGGIATVAQRDTLARMGCGAGLGPLFGDSLDAGTVADCLATTDGSRGEVLARVGPLRSSAA